MDSLRGFIALVVAILASMLGGPSSAAAAVPESPVAAYVYDGHHHTAVADAPATECGPPTAYDPAARADADPWLHGPSVRPNALAIYDYNGTALLAQTDSDTAAERSTGVISGHRCLYSGARVAANGATRLGETVSPLGRTYENADTYLGDVAKHYGINLRGVRPIWDHGLSPGVKGLTRQVEGGWIIRINPGFADEPDLANTIAHELSHARDFQKGLSSLEDAAYASGDALEEWIYGLR